jgi:hypothetical protein
MLLADVLFLAIVIYLAYRFIFNFLLPIVRTTHHVRRQFRENFGEPGNMGGSGYGSRRSGTQGSQPTGARNGAAGSSTSGGGKGSYKPPAEDYIDFEEVK